MYIYTLFSPYMENGFINLQRIVEQSIIAFITQGEPTVDVDISMRVRESIERGGRGERAFIIVQWIVIVEVWSHSQVPLLVYAITIASDDI